MAFGTMPTGTPAPGPDIYERFLATGAFVLLLLVLTALLRGAIGWSEVPAIVWMHMVSVLLPLALTVAQMVRPRGDRLHRLMGMVWAISLFATACISFAIREVNQGALSFIHIFSLLTVISVPMMVVAARTGRIAAHRRIARALTTGALLLAGYFTLLPGRVLGVWLYG